MIIPSIDLIAGNAVQLIGGKEMELDAGDPLPLAEKFKLAGDIAVIDLDAAMSQGSNREAIERLLKVASCRVGGGIRDADTALRWLDQGAAKVILGTRAVPEVLKQLPKERVIAALDAYDGEVVVEGWKTKTGASISEKMAELKDYVGGFLVTFVELEGRLQGTNLERVEELLEQIGDAKLTIAGGVSTLEEIKALDRLGVDAQVGMAIYTGRIHLGDAISAPLQKAPITNEQEQELWPTVVCDTHGTALGLAWSSKESLREAVDTQKGVYYSRSKQSLWVKGESSGATQKLQRISLDCDRDVIRFTVSQEAPGFCHLKTYSCWGEVTNVPQLAKHLASRLQSAPEGSYTKKLLEDPELLAGKLREEAQELAEANTPAETIWEAADLLYFALVSLAKAGVSFDEVERELERRALKVSRRG